VGQLEKLIPLPKNRSLAALGMTQFRNGVIANLTGGWKRFEPQADAWGWKAMDPPSLTGGGWEASKSQRISGG